MNNGGGIKLLYIVGAVSILPLALPVWLYCVTIIVEKLLKIIDDHIALVALRWIIADAFLYALALGIYWLARGARGDTVLDVIRKQKDYFLVSDTIFAIATVGAVVVFSISLLVFILNV